MHEEQILLEGHIAVEAALAAGFRDVYRILVRAGQNRRDLRKLLRAARQHDIKVETVSAAEIDSLAGGNSHGGVLAIVGPRRYVEIETLGTDARLPFVAMIDGVEDPFNFGQAVRALYAAGAHGLVVRPRNWTTAAGVVARASAGAVEHMPIAVAETVLDALEHFKSRGFVTACTSNRAGSKPLFAVTFDRPLFIVIGGERRGITRSVVDAADLLLEIPYGRPFDYSLGTAAATAVLAFEVMRQRQISPR